MDTGFGSSAQPSTPLGGFAQVRTASARVPCARKMHVHVRRLLLTAAAALLLAGCSTAEEEPQDVACTVGPDAVARALDAAPGRVAIEGTTTISACFRDARTDADLQNFGIVVTEVAEDLEQTATGDPRAALELGYLVGAARSGARASAGGASLELVRRIERTATLDGAPPEVHRAFRAGLDAGEARG